MPPHCRGRPPSSRAAEGDAPELPGHPENPMSLAPVLTPHGSLTLRQMDDSADFADGARLERAFGRGSGHGLLSLGADEVGAVLPPVLSYWRELGTRYLTALCALPGIGEGRSKFPVPVPADEELGKMAA